MSCNVFTGSAFHPWLCFMLRRFCNPHSANEERSPCWGAGHELSGGPTSSRGSCWCPRASPLCWDKTFPPEAEAVTTAGDAGLGIEVSSPSPEGNLSSLGCLGPCVLAGPMDSTTDFDTTLSPVGHLSLTTTAQKSAGLLSPLQATFLIKIGVFQIYLKGCFWILLKIKLNIPDQKVLLSFSLPWSFTQYFILS